VYIDEDERIKNAMSLLISSELFSDVNCVLDLDFRLIFGDWLSSE
jgi:hypothetical protein